MRIACLCLALIAFVTSVFSILRPYELRSEEEMRALRGRVAIMEVAMTVTLAQSPHNSTKREFALKTWDACHNSGNHITGLLARTWNIVDSSGHQGFVICEGMVERLLRLPNT